MSAEAADTPVKPRMPATTEITKNSSAHLRRVTVNSSGPAPSRRVASLTTPPGAGSFRRPLTRSDSTTPGRNLVGGLSVKTTGAKNRQVCVEIGLRAAALADLQH